MGNLLLKDEGIGVHIARTLQEMSLPDGVEVVDGGTSPEIYSCIESSDKLIVIDSIEAGGIPGSVYRILINDLTTEVTGLASIHDVNLISMLKMMRLLNRGPQETVIIGIQPKDMDWGTELSPELQQKIPQIVRIVLKETDDREPAHGGISCL